MKQRIEYIDIAKALLIICMLWSHYRLISSFQGVDDGMLTWMRSTVKFFATFFMQAFFLLTGFCSSFNSKFKEYLWKNTKTILIPGITLCIIDRIIYNILPGTPFDHTPTVIEWLVDGGPWFIFALYWAKLIYWPIAKLNLKAKLIICWGIYLIALIINQFLPIDNYLWFKHAMLMLPYLCMGHIVKDYTEIINKHMWWLALGGGMLLLVEFVLGLPMPAHDYNIGISLLSAPLHIINVFAGTFMILGISRKIGSNTFLQTIGKGTLFMYLMNECVLKAFVNACMPLCCESNLVTLDVYHLVLFIVIVVFFYILVRIIYGTKYLSWIVGKY